MLAREQEMSFCFLGLVEPREGCGEVKIRITMGTIRLNGLAKILDSFVEVSFEVSQIAEVIMRVSQIGLKGDRFEKACIGDTKLSLSDIGNPEVVVGNGITWKQSDGLKQMRFGLLMIALAFRVRGLPQRFERSPYA